MAIPSPIPPHPLTNEELETTAQFFLLLDHWGDSVAVVTVPFESEIDTSEIGEASAYILDITLQIPYHLRIDIREWYLYDAGTLEELDWNDDFQPVLPN